MVFHFSFVWGGGGGGLFEFGADPYLRGDANFHPILFLSTDGEGNDHTLGFYSWLTL